MSAFLVWWGKGFVLVALALAIGSLSRLTAATRHLVLALGLVSLPLLPVVALLNPISVAVEAQALVAPLEFSTTNAVGPNRTLAAADDGITWLPSFWVLTFAYIGVATSILVYWLIQLRRTGNWFRRTTALPSPLFEHAMTSGQLPRRTTLRQMQDTGSPLTWGLWRPSIVVPADWHDWPATTQQSSLAHEFAHVHRRDTLTASVGMLICCVFWINPLVWIVHRRMLQEAEKACDDVVVSSGVSAVDYADHLLTIARAKNLHTALAMASSSSLSQRVAALLDNNIRRVPMRALSLIAITGLAAAVVIPVSSLQAGAIAGGAVKSTASAYEVSTVPQIGKAVYDVLADAQRLVEDDSPAKAVEMANELLANTSLNSYEAAQTWNLLAFAHWRLEDTPMTIEAYLKVLEQGDIPVPLERATLRALFQLYFGEAHYENTITYIGRWTALTPTHDAGVTFIRATAYYQTQQFEAALRSALEVEEIATNRGETVKENWLYLQVVLYDRMNRLYDVEAVLAKLVAQYPKPQYETHLNAIREQLGGTG